MSGVLALCIIVCSAVVAVRNMNDTDAVSVSEEQTLIHKDKKLKTNEERVALLQECGWTVDSEPLEFMEVKIPEEFNGAYTEYNEIQKNQGMDLSKYSGKRAMRYTYKVNNHPSNEEGVVVNIIIYKNKLIAGDVCSPKLGGFMHGLYETSQASEEIQPSAENSTETKEQQD